MSSDPQNSSNDFQVHGGNASDARFVRRDGEESSVAIENESASMAPSEEPQIPKEIYLRKNLVLHEHEGNAAFPSVVLEDLAEHKFFRLGEGESSFIKSLLANPSVADAFKTQQSDANPLNEHQIAKLCQWLQTCGFVEGQPKQARKAPANVLSKLFFFRLPLFDPDEFLTHCVRKAGFLFTPQATVVAVLVALLGCCIAFAKWSDFQDSYQNLFTSWRGLWLVVVWLGLKVVHETFHGAVCKRYGGTVPDAGLAMILLVPIAYVDVSSSWKFASRWQRLHVTLAGVLAELFIAGIAMFVWLYSDSITLQQAAADVVLAASVTSLLFNLNPLLKFDGYFALADVSGIDNLYQFGQSYAKYFGTRYLLGLETTPPNLPVRYQRGIKAYGLAAAVWRFVTVSGLLMGAAVMFAGAGVALAIAGIISFVVLPLAKLSQHLWTVRLAGDLSASKVLFRLALIFGIALGALFLVPAEVRRTSPGIVEYDPPSVLRAPVSGFVDRVFVENGEQVEEGDVLLVLRNDTLQLEIDSLRTQLAQAQQRSRTARWELDNSKAEEESSNVLALTTQLNEKREQTNQMVVRAPHAGRIIARSLETLVGQYLEQGTEIGAVGNERSKRIKISLSEWEASRAGDWKDDSVRVSVANRFSWLAPVSHIESRASEIAPDVSLTAVAGGALTVKQKEGVEDPVLVEPRVNAYISLDSDRAETLHCGQRCFVLLGCWRQSLGGKLIQLLSASTPT